MEVNYIDVLSPEFVTKWGHYKGIYLISNQTYFQNGVCKVGLTNTSFNSRFKAYRAHYAFVDSVYYVLG